MVFIYIYYVSFSFWLLTEDFEVELNESSQQEFMDYVIISRYIEALKHKKVDLDNKYSIVSLS